MRHRTKVQIDCEKAKHTNTGLHTFCIELAKSLNRIAPKYGIDLNFLIEKRNKSDFGGEHRYISLLDRLKFCTRYPIFHSTFQSGKFIPKNSNLIITVHDLNFLYDKPEHKRAKYIKKYLKRIKNADYLVFISEFARQDFIRIFGEIKIPNRVIYNGCSLFDGQTTTTPAAYQPQGEFLFSIGTVLRKKNFHTLPALLQDNDLELIIAGNPSAYSEQIMTEAAKYGVTERVKIIGAVSDQDKDWYYRNCKAFLFPSIAEGFGIPAIEALAYGKPTFLSQHTSLPEIGANHAYYFDKDFAPEKMVEEFKSGMADFQGRDVQAQIDYARSFTWDNAAREYCEVYKEFEK